MTNKQVFESFARGKSAQSNNAISTGKVLISYRTPIMAWKDGQLLVTNEKYSVTTSKQQNQAIRACGVKPVYVNQSAISALY